MGKKRTFKINNDIVDIPVEEVDVFLKEVPTAKEVQSYLIGKDTVDIPIEEVDVFKSEVPDAKPLFQDDSDTTDVPSGPPIPPTRGEINEEDIPVVSMDETGEVSPVVKLDKKTRDIFVDHATRLPDNIKLDGTRSNIFINQFSKRTGIDKRALRKIFNEGIMADEQYKQLQKEYEKNPDNTDVLYQIGGILNVLGRHDLAYEAYDALEGKLKKIGEQEFADPNNPNKRPDYIQQRQLPAVAGMAYTEELRGNKDNAQRLKKIAEQYGYTGQEFTSVGEGNFIQPTSSTPSTYGFSGRRGDDTMPTKESEYLNLIAEGIGQSSLIKPMSEMGLHGLEKTAKAFEENASIADRTMNLVTGVVETAMGAAGLATPAGAIFGLPFMQVQNSVPTEVAEWMMPVSKKIADYYKEQSKEAPDWATNTAVLADFVVMGLLGAGAHGIGKSAGKAIRRSEIKNIGKEIGKEMSEMPLEEVAQTLNHIEGKIQELGGVEQYVAERTKVLPEIAKRAEEIKQDIKLEQDSQIEVEPYEPKPQPNSLATVKEGTSVMMDGVEGIVERGDDGTWYFTNDEGKSTQIKVEDKYNPTEPLKELGIQVMPEVSPEQVARAVADAEQIGEVTYKGKQYFVSLDRVGNETPSGDFVLRRMPDGSLKDVFGSHPDPKFAADRKLAIINQMLREKGLPPRKKLTEAGKKVEAKVEPKVGEVVEPIKTQAEEVPIASEPVKTETAEEVTIPKEDGKNNQERGQEGREDVLTEAQPVPQEVSTAEGAVTPEVVGEKKKAEVRFADNIKVEAEYEIIEADDLQASHLTSGARNEKHSISHAQPKERNDVASKAQQDKIAADPDFTLVSEDNSAYSGAPIVNESNNVIQGNNRSIGLKKHYQGGGSKYKADLAANAEKYGYTKEQVEGMKNPILVRKIKASDKTAVKLGQYKSTDLETGSKERLNPVATSRKLSPEKRASLARLIFEGDYETLKDAIRENSKRILDLIKGDLSPAELRTLVKSGEDNFTATGMDDMVSLATQLVFEGGDAILPEVWDGLPARARKNIEKAIPEILETTGEKSLLPSVQNAMLATHEFVASGVKNFNEWVSQYDMFKGVKPEDVFTPLELAIADKLANAKTQGEVKALFKEYAESVKGKKADLFEAAVDGKSASESVEKVFKAKLNEGDLKPKSERSDKATPQNKAAEAKPEPTKTKSEKPTIEVTKRDSAKRAIDDFADALLNLPGMKDMSKGAEKAGVSAEAFVNKLRELAKQAVDKGFDTIEAIKDAIEKIKGLPDFADFVKGREDQILKIAKEKFGDALKGDEDLFSLKNKMTDVEREALGLETRENITADQRRTVADMQQAAKNFKGDVQDLISESINMRRTLGAEEQLVLLHEHIRLSKERRALEAEIIKQSEKGDIVKVEKLREQVNDILAQDTDVLNAIAMTGSELGRSLSIRRLIMKQDYSLAESVRQYEAATGKEIPAEVKERFAQIETELAEVTERLAELEKAKSEWDLQKAADAIKRSVETEKKGRKTPTRSGDRLRALADKIEAGKINKLVGFKSSTGFDAAWDLSLKAVAQSLRATAKLADAIEAGLRTIRETDWYKALTDKQDFENKYEQHLLKEYEGAEYEKPSFTKEGELNIPKQLLRDLVEQGVTDAKDLVQKVHELVKEELPEVTEREVQDAISGYGKKIEPNSDAIAQELNSLKQDMKLASGLEDAEAGKGVKRSGFQRPKPTDAQREMKRKIREELKKHPEDQADVDRKWATALDAIKTRLRNSIADNQKRIADLKAGTAEPKTKKELTKLDAEAQAIKDMNDLLKQEIENLEGKKELSDEARVNAAIAAAERATKEYERRTEEMRRTGNYTTTPNKPLPSDPKLDLAKALREQAKQNYDAALKTNNLDVIAATSKALDRAIEKERELQDKVRTGNVSYTQKAKSLVDTNNPNLVARKEAIKKLNETINAMREQAGVAEARRIELWKRRKQKSIDELEAQKAAGVYKPKTEAREQPLDMEMMRLKAREDRLKFERDVALEVARMSQSSTYQKFQQHLVDIAGVPKSLLASLDLSAPLRQGLMLSARRPTSAIKAGWEMIKQGFSEKKFNEWNDAMVASDAYITAKHSKLFLSEKTARLTAREEAFMSNLAEKIWGAGRLVKGSNRAYSTFLNYMRMDAFTKFHDAALQSGLKGKELQTNLDAYADFVNNATGRGKLGALEGSAGVLNFFMFSPRYVTSRINLLFHGLTGYAFKKGMTNRVRVEAYKTLGAYVATVGTTLAILDAALPNASVELDPRSSDFGKLKVGNVRYDFAAGMLQPIVLFSKILSNSVKNRYGEIEEMGSKWGQKNGLELLWNFYRSKSSPVAGTAISLYTGKDFMGEDYGYKDAIIRNVTPLYLQDMNTMYEEYGAGGIAQSALPAIFGVGVQAYDKNPDLKQAKLSNVASEDIDIKQYAPPKYSDENYTLNGKEVTVTKEDREKVNTLRNEIAGSEINKAYKQGDYFVAYIGDVKMSKLTREQHKKVMDTIYAKALKEAKNKVFPKGWTEKKPKADWSNAK